MFLERMFNEAEAEAEAEAVQQTHVNLTPDVSSSIHEHSVEGIE